MLSYLYSSAVVILAAQVMVIRRPDLAVITPYGCDAALDTTVATLEAASGGTETVAAAASRTCFERLSRCRRAIQIQRNEASGSQNADTPVGSALDDPVLAQIFSLLPPVEAPNSNANNAAPPDWPTAVDDLWSNPSGLLANHQGLSDLWANADGGPPQF